MKKTRKQGIVLAILLVLSLVMAACAGAPPAGDTSGAGGAAPAVANPAAPAGESQLPVDVPREELFVADQIFRYSVIDNYNFWVNGPHNPHRHALMMETLWYRDQETSELLMGAAISEPVYNEDFTQMNVDLRDNIYYIRFSTAAQFTTFHHALM